MRLIVTLLTIVLTASAKSPKKMDRASPQTAGDYFQAADYAMEAENFDAAERIAREGQAAFPHAIGFHLLLGDILVERHKTADAFYEYQWEVMRTGADRPIGREAQMKAGNLVIEGRGTDADELRMIIAAVQQMATEPSKSADTLERYASRRANVFVLRVLFAEALAKSKQDAEATAAFRELIKRDPFFVPAYVDLGELLLRTGKEPEGKALVAKAREIDPDHWRLKPPKN